MSITKRSSRLGVLAVLVVGGGMGPGCSGDDASVAGAPANGEDVGRATEPLVDELVAKYLGKEGAAIYSLGKDIAAAYSGVGTAIQTFEAISTLLGAGTDAPFEQVMQQQLEEIKARLDSVIRAITDASWLEAERDASIVFSDALWAAEFAHDWARINGDTPLGLDTPGGVQIDEASWVATHTFMEDSWYWFPSSSGRRFDHRLALPRLVNSIAARLSVLLVTRPGFVETGEASDELWEYRDRLGQLLDQIEQTELTCYSPGPVFVPPGSDPSSVVTRICSERLTGAWLQSTVGSPRTDLSMRTELLKGLGMDPVRALRDSLYLLALNAPAFTTRCANEGETCSFSGVRSVRYGAEGAYFYRNVKNSIGCSNAVFGDPKRGTVKQCHLGGQAWTPCVNENQACYFSGVKMVRYGNGNSVRTLTSGSVDCSNLTFGDPAPGLVKSCDYTEPLWTRCADEYGTCSVSGSRYIRFGWGNSWTYSRRSGSFACDTSSFADPAPGTIKVCEVASSF